MTVAQIQTSPTDLDMIDKINEIIRNLLYVDDSTIKIIGGVISAAPPIGTVYVQFPGKSAPADLYGGEWTNISSQFAGQFFRAEGGNAAAFGNSQNDGAPNVSGTFGIPKNEMNYTPTGSFYFSGVGANNLKSGEMANNNGRIYGFSAANSNNKYGAATEFRPYNTAIRIWEKTG